jgi:acetoacetyl-CoA synthetase
MARFMQLAGKKDYAELHRWSVERSEDFWALVWRFCEVRGAPGARLRSSNGERMPGAKWFPQARLNFAENLLREADDAPAMVFWGEDQVKKRRVSRRELRDSRFEAAAGAAREGVGQGRPRRRISAEHARGGGGDARHGEPGRHLVVVLA